MINELYRVLNVVLLFLVGLLFCSIQSVLLKAPLVSWLELDLLLLMVVYLSLHRNLVEGCLVVIMLGRIIEVHSGSPSGLLITCYLAVFILILFTREMFLVGNTFSAIILAMASGLIWKIAFFILAREFGILGNVWRSSIEFLIPYLLGLGLCCRPIFELLQRVDYFTKYDRESESRQLLGEDF